MSHVKACIVDMKNKQMENGNNFYPRINDHHSKEQNWLNIAFHVTLNGSSRIEQVSGSYRHNTYKLNLFFAELQTFFFLS